MQVLSSLSSIPFYAPSAGFAPTNSADVSAIASAYAESAASSKLDSTASSSFYPSDNPSGFISGVDLSDYATTAYVDSSLSGKLDTTAQVVTSIGVAAGALSSINGYGLSAGLANSAGTATVWLGASSKLDASAASDFALTAQLEDYLEKTASSQFLTAVPDGYATTEYVDSSISGFAYESAVSGWTAKQDKLTFGYNTADQISSIDGSALGGMDEAAVSAIASAYAGSAVSSKQDALTFGYDTASAISSIDGSALAGGGGGEADWSAESGQPGYIENKPVPKMLVAGQGITITENSTGLVVASTNTLYTAGSGLTLNGTTFAVDTATVQGKITYDYDASGNISGIDGSSLVGGDPEAADLYVQAPLYTGVSGGSAYIGWNNETVLYSNYTGRPTNTGGTIALNESPLNFQYVEVYLNGLSATSTSAGWANSYQKIDTVTLSSVPGLTFVGLLSGNSTWWDVGCAYTGVSSTTWTKTLGYTKQVNSTAAGMMDNVNHLNIWKVVGINRTAGE